MLKDANMAERLLINDKIIYHMTWVKNSRGGWGVPSILLYHVTNKLTPFYHVVYILRYKYSPSVDGIHQFSQSWMKILQMKSY